MDDLKPRVDLPALLSEVAGKIEETAQSLPVDSRGESLATQHASSLRRLRRHAQMVRAGMIDLDVFAIYYGLAPEPGDGG